MPPSAISAEKSGSTIRAFFQPAGPNAGDARGWLRIEIEAANSLRPHEQKSGKHSLTITMMRRGAPRVLSYSDIAAGTASHAEALETFARMGSVVVCEAVCGCWPCLGSRSCVETLERILLPLLRQEVLLTSLRRPPQSQAAYKKIFGENPPQTVSMPPFEEMQRLANRFDPAMLRHVHHVERLCPPYCNLFPNLAVLHMIPTHLWARFETSISADGTIFDVDNIRIDVHWAVTSLVKTGNIGGHKIDFPNHPGSNMQSWCRVAYPLEPECISVLWSLIEGKGQQLGFAELQSTLASYMADVRRRTLLIATIEYGDGRGTFQFVGRDMHVEGQWKDFESTWETRLIGPKVKGGFGNTAWEPGNHTLTMQVLLFSTVEDMLLFQQPETRYGEHPELYFAQPSVLFPTVTLPFVVAASGLADNPLFRPCEWASTDPKSKPFGLKLDFSHLSSCTSCNQTYVSALSPAFSALKSKGANASGTTQHHGPAAYESIGSGGMQLLVDDFVIDLASSYNIIRHMGVATVQEHPVMQAERGKEESQFARGELERRGIQVDSVEFPGSVLELNGILHVWYLAMSTAICYATSSDQGQSWIKPSIHPDGSNYIFVHNRSETRLRSYEVSVTFDILQEMYLMTYCKNDDQTIRLLHSNDGKHWCDALRAL